MEVHCGEPSLIKNTRTDLKNLKQGPMSVKEYSANFHTIAANLQDWLERLLVDYYRDGLNMDLTCKAINYANPQTLVEWIQVASEMEACHRLVKSIKQQRPTLPAPSKATGDKSLMRSKQTSVDPTREHFKAGRCLTCG